MEKPYLKNNIEIYEKCLNRTYNDNLFKPIIKYIYFLVSMFEVYIHQSSSFEFNNELEKINNQKKEFINKLVNVLYNITIDNRINSLHPILELFDVMKIHIIDIPDYLYALYYPEEYIKNDFKDKSVIGYKRDYNDLFKELSLNNDYLFNNLYQKYQKLDIYLLKLLDLYANYCNSFDQTVIDEKENIIIFQKISPYILAKIYLYKIDINEVKKIFNYIINNIKEFEGFLYLNSNLNEKKIELYLADLILKNYSKEKVKIK